MGGVANNSMAFFQTMFYLAELGKIQVFESLFQIPNATVNQFCGFGGSFGGKIFFFYQCNAKTSQGGIQGTTRPACSAPNDANIEGFVL